MNPNLCRSYFAFFIILSGICSGSEDLGELPVYPEIIQTRPGIFHFGAIEINKVKREISLPAVCNQTSGLIEYAMVHQKGKVHESLFRTSVSPRLIHATFLLLNEKPNSQFFHLFDQNPNLVKDFPAITVTAEWDDNGSKKKEEISSMVLNQNNGAQLTNNVFVFTGSQVIGGQYLAEMDGSILAIYHDSRATINCSDPNSVSDDVWIANAKNMPTKDLAVVICFKLPKRK